MLSKKFLSDGDKLSPACATSGNAIDAVSKPADNPATAFSFIEEEPEALMTTNLLVDFDVAICFDGLIGNGLKKASTTIGCLFWLLHVSGIAIDTIEVVAISFAFC
ncbi:hypothetical protein P3L10_025379 [Capsicum annuum]